MSEVKCINCKCFVKMQDYRPDGIAKFEVTGTGLCRMFPGTPLAVPGYPVGLPYYPIRHENDMCFWFIDKENPNALPLWLMPLFEAPK